MENINKNIECSVNSCAYHRDHHCTLNAIQVGCCDANVHFQCTDRVVPPPE